jgi:hypothetical protein
MNLLFKLLLRAGVSGPSYTLDLDLTASLDSRITFTRAGSRNYITGGVLTNLASSNVPAFESWDGKNRGMAIEPGFTNLLLHSNAFSQATWSKGAITGPVAGDVGPGSVMTQLHVMTSDTSNTYHKLEQVLSTRNSGERSTFSCYVKPASGAVNWSVILHMSQQYGNVGPHAFFRIDGVNGSTAMYDSNIASDVIYSIDKLSGGVFRVSMTCTWVTSSWKEFWICTGNNVNSNINYAGTTNDKFQIFGAQVAVANGPTGYVATGAATASQAAESAIFNDTAWLTGTSEGTFVVEHDCWSGPIIGSGANTVLSATVPGKTAIAWSGVTSDTVNNGGATTVGVQPTFSGSDVRLLSTSSASNAGHIKSIRFYPTRLSVAELQVLTAKTVISTANPGAVRGISIDNYLPREFSTTTGALLDYAVRSRLKLGGFACSEITLDFPNFAFPGTANTNDYTVLECALERITGVNEYVPVTFSGLRTKVVTAGSIDSIKSDTILPSAFTGLTEFPANTEFMIRMKLRVSTTGHKWPVSISGLFAQRGSRYDPAATTISAVDAVGTMTVVSGTNPSIETYIPTPIMLGKFVSGDPKTLFVIGDSIVGGTTTGALTAGGAHFKQAAEALGLPMITYALGGSNQMQLSTTNWRPYLAYSRVLIDEMGTNNGNGWIVWYDYYHAARTTYNYDKIIKTGLLARVTNSGDFTTEGGQTGGLAYPALNFAEGPMIDLEKYGYVDKYLPLVAARGVDQSKWIVNGTPYYATADGTHPSDAAVALLKTEFQAALSAITVT